MERKKILVVDDEKINRLLLSKTLGKKYDILEAENGVEALDKLSPDVSLILLDLIMPVMNGLEFMQTLRTKPEYSNIPIIVLTTDDEKKQEAILNGAKEVIIKPINPTMIAEKVASYL